MPPSLALLFVAMALAQQRDTCAEEGDGSDGRGATSLLQTRMQVQRGAPVSPAELALASTSPAPDDGSDAQRQCSDPPEYSVLDPALLGWLHVPKAGTSWLNALFTYACTGVPDNETIDVKLITSVVQLYEKYNCTEGFELVYEWDGSLDGHAPLYEDLYEERKGQWVSLFRQPEQFLISEYNFRCYHAETNTNSSLLNLTECIDYVEGCAVKMMNGYACGDPDVELTDALLDNAISRLDEGFAFVGIQEEWDLSVCLFHAMFGSECHEREFGDVRPGSNHTDGLYDTSILDGWTDVWDGPFYEYAKAIFEERLVQYNVSNVTCAERICCNVPEYFTEM